MEEIQSSLGFLVGGELFLVNPAALGVGIVGLFHLHTPGALSSEAWSTSMGI